MNCQACQELLVDHLHHELEDQRRARVHAHLADCGECARACCRLQAEFDDIADAHRVRAPAALRETIRTELEAHFAPPWWKRVGLLIAKPVPAYGALALAMLPILYLASPLATRSRAAASDHSAPAAEARIKGYDASTTLGAHTIVF